MVLRVLLQGRWEAGHIQPDRLELKSSFTKRVKRQSKNPCSNAKFRDHVLEKLYQNTIFELWISIARSFSGMALNAFWKRTVQLFNKDSRLASVDLSYAYYAVPIAQCHREYLRFVWKSAMYEYQALPNGLSPGPWLFTKLLKPIYAHMGQLGFTCFPYIDDSFIMEST